MNSYVYHHSSTLYNIRSSVPRPCTSRVQSAATFIVSFIVPEFLVNVVMWWMQDLTVILEAVRIMAVALSPVVPELCSRIYSQLGYTEADFKSISWVRHDLSTCYSIDEILFFGVWSCWVVDKVQLKELGELKHTHQNLSSLLEGCPCL